MNFRQHPSLNLIHAGGEDKCRELESMHSKERGRHA
jgi:hypothetical protein